jgi:hypothetical protein
MTYIQGGPTIQGLSAEDINNAVHRANQLKDIAGLIGTASDVPTMEQFNTVVSKLNDIIAKLTVV